VSPPGDQMNEKPDWSEVVEALSDAPTAASVDLTNGCTFAFPPKLAQGLEVATEELGPDIRVARGKVA
jgi:hypothetical protein